MKIIKMINVGCLAIFAATLIACGAPNLQNNKESDMGGAFSGSYTSSENENVATLDMYQKKDGTYVGEISIESEGDSVFFFSFSGKEKGNKISYSDGEMTKLVYDEEGEFTEQSLYEDSSGRINKKDEFLLWKDENEDTEYKFLLGQ